MKCLKIADGLNCIIKGGINVTIPNSVGRPLAFNSVQELEDKIQAYFDYCDSRTATKVTKQGDLVTIPWPRPYTISGMAVFLDCDRRTLINYSHKEEYFPTIARARSKCENWAEEQLFDGNDRGAKFSLINNYSDWKDKQEVEINPDQDGVIKVSFVNSDE